MLKGLALKLRGLRVEPVAFDPGGLGDDATLLGKPVWDATA